MFTLEVYDSQRFYRQLKKIEVKSLLRALDLEFYRTFSRLKGLFRTLDQAAWRIPFEGQAHCIDAACV